MILLSHALGNANVRQAALAFVEAGILREFQTAMALNGNGLGQMFSGMPGAHELRRRNVPMPVAPLTRQRPFREILRLLATRAGWDSLTAHERGFASVDAVFCDLDRHVARRLRSLSSTAVYAYEDGAVESFKSARDLGVAAVYDLPIGYWRAGQRIYQEEAEREPEWAATLGGIQDSQEKLERKDRELELANAVFVASTFTKTTLAEAPGLTAPVHVVPYGAPSPIAVSGQAVRPHAKLRVLFAGSLTQRKGISYLLAALGLLGSQVELTLLGAKSGTCAPMREAVRRHRWIPSLPHCEVLREMAQHDVLVFPSLFEGFGLVILEAMAQGLPVITTAHTAGPDIIEDGVDGFLVPIRDAAAISICLELLLREPERLRAMKEAARSKAALFTWKNYRERLALLVKAAIEMGSSITTPGGG